MWEEEREFEIFDEVEEYDSQYDNTDSFSYLDMGFSTEEEDFEDEDGFYND